jgi:hypothetical protein
LEKSRKWIIREGFTGISRSGSGAPIACGWKKSLGFLTLLLVARVFVWPKSKAKAKRVFGGGGGGLSGRPPYLEEMDAAASDSTQDWLLPEHSRPPLIGELERRVELALVTARASEAAVMSVGAAAIDAAEQARRAAELAERASVAALDAQGRVASLAVEPAPASSEPAEAGAGDDSLSNFSARADRLVARLRQLQRVPLPAPASDVAGRPQSAY